MELSDRLLKLKKKRGKCSKKGTPRYRRWGYGCGAWEPGNHQVSLSEAERTSPIPGTSGIQDHYWNYLFRERQSPVQISPNKPHEGDSTNQQESEEKKKKKKKTVLPENLKPRAPKFIQGKKRKSIIYDRCIIFLCKIDSKVKNYNPISEVKT